jgi:hypothetical protein
VSSAKAGRAAESNNTAMCNVRAEPCTEPELLRCDVQRKGRALHRARATDKFLYPWIPIKGSG